MSVLVFVLVLIASFMRAEAGADQQERRELVFRDNILHTRNRHLRTHPGWSVAVSSGFSAVFSDGSSLFNGMFHRIDTFPVDFTGISRWTFTRTFQRDFTFVSSGVSYFAPGLFLLLVGSEESFLVRTECPRVVLWRPGDLHCRAPLPPEAWNGLTPNPPSLRFEPETSCIRADPSAN